MKISSLHLAGALCLGLGLTGCNPASDDTVAASGAQTSAAVAPHRAKPLGQQTVSSEPFADRARMAAERGDWPTLIRVGRKWQKVSPQESAAVFAEAQATYMLGDIEATIPVWEKLLAKFPSTAPLAAGWLKTARAVRHNFPNLKLKPLQFQPGDASREQDLWQAKAATMLRANRYDEIETVAAQLQKSNASNAKGSPYLSFFFGGLESSESLAPVTAGANGAAKVSEVTQRANDQKNIAAWRAARPASTLARLVSIETGTDAAWRIRGDGFSSTITPAMSAQIDVALKKGARELKALPPTAFDSPLAYMVALDLGQLSSAPRQFLDTMFEDGIKKFPAYLPLYRTRAVHLLPRWFGQCGESLAMMEQRANQIGGDEGDVFYSRAVWYVKQMFGNLGREFDFDYPRAAHGLAVLSQRYPNSISVADARLALAFDAQDWKVAQEVLISPRGYLLDTTWNLWAKPLNQSEFAEQRMLILGETL